jgi:hypothetical protein
VDRFVIYDDVAFIKGGWINRNRILLDGRDHLFALPLRRASQNRRSTRSRSWPRQTGQRSCSRP